MKPVFLTSAILIAIGLSASAAAADTVCMPAGEMKASLIDWYGEKPVAAPSEDREQLWVSEKTGKWTLVKTLADGNACVLAQGEDWMGGANQQELLAALD
jgi:hypothetical protein